MVAKKYNWINRWEDPDKRRKIPITKAIKTRLNLPKSLAEGKSNTRYLYLMHMEGEDAKATDVRVQALRAQQQDLDHAVETGTHTTLTGLLLPFLLEKKGILERSRMSIQKHIHTAVMLGMDDFMVPKYHRALAKALSEGLSVTSGKPYSESYKKNVFRQVKELLAWAALEEFIARDPLVGFNPKWKESRGIPFTVDEARLMVSEKARYHKDYYNEKIETERVYAECGNSYSEAGRVLGLDWRTIRMRMNRRTNPHWYWACVMIYTGLRNTSAANLRWDQFIKRRTGYYIVIQPNEPGNKTKRTITISVQPELEHILFGDGADKKGLFDPMTTPKSDRVCQDICFRDHDPVSPDSASSRAAGFRLMMKVLGIERTADRRLCPHSCRHTYVTLSSAIGMNQDKLGLAVGHTSSSTTERYKEGRTEHMMQIEDEGWTIHDNPDCDFYLRREPPQGYLTT